MKNKLFNILVVFLTLFVLIEIMIRKELIQSTVNLALNMWVNNLIPALFPFFIISDILINYNITSYIPSFFKNFLKWLFGISDNMLTIFILSMVSGFPSNARNTKTLYVNKMIDLDEANHILMFSHFANPLFILTTCGLFFFNNQKIGIILLISHYLSNILLGILLKSYFCHKNSSNLLINKNNTFGRIFINAIKGAVDTTILICGIVTSFLVISVIICRVLNLNVYNMMLVKGILEITIGMNALSSINIKLIYKVVIASCFLAFGGISVHMQVMSQISDTDIKYRYFLLGRILQMIISGIICYFICLIIKI